MDLDQVRAEWDAAAATFDLEPDHGLLDPGVRNAWWQLLEPLLPVASSRVADLGCGTGTLAVLLAENGHEVTGVDLSPEMIARARAKAAAAGLAPRFIVGDAASPALPSGSLDVVLARHVVWALPAPATAIRAWVDLLAPGGILLLVEGRWSTGAGLAAEQVRALLPADVHDVQVIELPDPALWGKEIHDQRYVLVARI